LKGGFLRGAFEGRLLKGGFLRGLFKGVFEGGF
jgi:hypothetical protein